MGRWIRVFWWALNVITSVSCKKVAKGDLTTEREGDAAGSEEGGEDPKLTTARTTALRAGKGKQINSPLEPLRERGFRFNPVRPFGLVASRTVESRTLCCFKPSSS